MRFIPLISRESDYKYGYADEKSVGFSFKKSLVNF